MRRAGLPATIEYAGTSVVTTAHAETTLPSPIVTPGKMTARPPIHTLSPIEIGLTSESDGGLILQTRLRIRRVPVRIEHPYARCDPAIASDRNALADRECAFMSDSRSAADDERGPLCVPRCEGEAAFSVDQHVVSDD